MPARCPRTRERGFTLTEAVIALTVLIVIMSLSMTLLFAMRTFAMRQQLGAEPRQTARQAVDYVAENCRGAAVITRNPNIDQGILVPYVNGQQAIYNNVQNAALGDLNTDIICVTRPTGAGSFPITTWPGYQHAANFEVFFAGGCPNDDTNQQRFLEETGAIGGEHILVLVDSIGQVCYYQIAPWNGTNPASHCNGAAPAWAGTYIHVVGNVGSPWNPPGGHPELVQPIFISATQFMTLRVKNRTLQQKPGWINPANPDDGFFDLLNNVVDLQFTYFMNDGRLFNHTVAGQFPNANHIPNEPSMADPLSCRNVIGIGVYVTTRSAVATPTGMRSAPTGRPTVCDHAGAARDGFFYFTTFSGAFIRNRMLGF